MNKINFQINHPPLKSSIFMVKNLHHKLDETFKVIFYFHISKKLSQYAHLLIYNIFL